MYRSRTIRLVCRNRTADAQFKIPLHELLKDAPEELLNVRYQPPPMIERKHVHFIHDKHMAFRRRKDEHCIYTWREPPPADLRFPPEWDMLK